MAHLDLPEGHREHEPTSSKALNLVKADARAVRDTVVDHPASSTAILALVGLAAFLLGHAAGYRKAVAEQERPRFRVW